MKRVFLFLLMVVLNTACGSKPPEIPEPVGPEPVGDTREHYDWLSKECDINEKLIDESSKKGEWKSASQLGRRNYCTEMEEMRERITGILDSTAPGAKDF